MGTRTNKPKEIEAIEEVKVDDDGFLKEYDKTEEHEELISTHKLGVEEFNQELRQKLDIAEKEVKKRTKGPRNEIYLLKAFKSYMLRLEEAKMLTPEDKEQLTAVHKRMTERWIGLTL